MNTIIETPELRKISFTEENVLSVYLSNGRTVLVPLDTFPSIAQLSDEQRQDFEIIDNQYLSFLATDEVYGLEELLGIASGLHSDERHSAGRQSAF